MDWHPVILSLKCAVLSVLLNLPWGIFWGWILARKSFAGKAVLQTCLNIPLVLPPVLTGYFLLSLLSPNSLIGRFILNVFNIRFVLDWKGAVLAAAVVSSSFMIQMVKVAIERIDVRLELVARNLGADFKKVFFTITLPLSRQGIISGCFLVFARSIGEFGATVMVVGNIPGKTQTIPLSIYSKVYLGREMSIGPLVIVALLFAYLGLGASYYYNSKTNH